MATPSFSGFPFEVVEQICRHYDLQFQDVTSLRACSLVCRMWTLAAQRFLFRSLSLRDEPSWKRLFNILKDHGNIRPLVEELYIYFQLIWDDESNYDLLHEYLPLVTKVTYVGAFPGLVFLEQLRSLRSLTIRQLQFDEVAENKAIDPKFVTYKDIALDEFHLPDTHLPYLVNWLATTSTHETKSLRAVTLSLKYHAFATMSPSYRQITRIVERYTNLDHLRLNLSGTLFMANQSLGFQGIGTSATKRLTLELRPQTGVGILVFASSLLGRTTFSELREVEILIHLAKIGLREDRAGEPGSFLLDNAREGSAQIGATDEEMIQRLKLPERLCQQLQKVMIKMEGDQNDFPPRLMRMFGDAHVRGVVFVQRQAPNMLGW